MEQHSSSSPTPRRRASRSGGRSARGGSRTNAGLLRLYVDVLGWSILFIWILSMLLDTIPSLEYEPKPIVHGLMTIVVTAAFGSGLVQRKENGNGG